MPEAPNLEDSDLTLSTVVKIILVTVSLTASAVTIYWRFNALEKDTAILHQLHKIDKEIVEKDINRVESRLEKITDRNKFNLDELEIRIKALEIPHSDKKDSR